MKTIATLAFGLLLIPSVSFAATLTQPQVDAILSVLLAFGVDTQTVSNVRGILTNSQATTTPISTVPVNQTPIIPNQPVYFGSMNPVIPNQTPTTTPATTTLVVQSPVMQPTITVIPWLYVDGEITKNPTTIPVSTPDGNGKKYQVIYTVQVSPSDSKWLIDITYPTKAQGNPQGDTKVIVRPSKNIDFFGDAVSGAFYAYAPGTYTTTFVAHNGTDTATTTNTIIVQ